MSYAFIDRVLECEPGTRIVAVKALALNEEIFRDHFPGMPVLPGAMILEAFVQAAGRCLEAAGEAGDWVLHSVSNMRFNRFATPGEVLRLEVERDGEEDGALRFKARALVEEERVCRARFSVRKTNPL